MFGFWCNRKGAGFLSFGYGKNRGICVHLFPHRLSRFWGRHQMYCHGTITEYGCGPFLLIVIFGE